MQKFSVATWKGFIHTNDFIFALKILEMEFEGRSSCKKKKRSPRGNN